jgi:ATP synthase F1 gamma subunit
MIVKITSSSKMIAAAKFRMAERTVYPVRPLSETFFRFWKKVSGIEEFNYESWEEIMERGAEKNGKLLIVPVTADKGLCGATNSSVTRPLRNFLENHEDPYSLVLVGDRAKSALAKPYIDNVHCIISGNSKEVPVSAAVGAAVARACAEVDEYDNIVYIWNLFKNAMMYDTTYTVIPSYKRLVGEGVVAGYVIDKHRETLANLHEFTHSILSYYFLCETAAVEQSQRMNAMDNSTKNAEEVIEKISIQYNRMRQAKITTELGEIISGASAVEDM